MDQKKDKQLVLQSCLGKAQGLAELVEYSADSIVSKAIIDEAKGTVTLFAFDQGQKLSEHTAPYHALVQVLDGAAELTIGGEAKTVRSGQVLIMPANVPHAVLAKKRFKMLLTMIRS